MVRPYGVYLLIRLDPPAPRVSKGGIIIPDTCDEAERFRRGTVLRMGHLTCDSGVKEGDLVVLAAQSVQYGSQKSAHDGATKNMGGEEHHLIKWFDILFVCDPEVEVTLCTCSSRPSPGCWKSGTPGCPPSSA